VPPAGLLAPAPAAVGGPAARLPALALLAATAALCWRASARRSVRRQGAAPACLGAEADSCLPSLRSQTWASAE
jgi:hypothetical protein